MAIVPSGAVVGFPSGDIQAGASQSLCCVCQIRETWLRGILGDDYLLCACFPNCLLRVINNPYLLESVGHCVAVNIDIDLGRPIVVLVGEYNASRNVLKLRGRARFL